MPPHMQDISTAKQSQQKIPIAPKFEYQDPVPSSMDLDNNSFLEKSFNASNMGYQHNGAVT